jgi:hypothetical protein
MTIAYGFYILTGAPLSAVNPARSYIHENIKFTITRLFVLTVLKFSVQVAIPKDTFSVFTCSYHLYSSYMLKLLFLTRL